MEFGPAGVYRVGVDELLDANLVLTVDDQGRPLDEKGQYEAEDGFQVIFASLSILFESPRERILDGSWPKSVLGMVLTKYGPGIQGNFKPHFRGIHERRVYINRRTLPTPRLEFS